MFRVLFLTGGRQLGEQAHQEGTPKLPISDINATAHLGFHESQQLSGNKVPLRLGAPPRHSPRNDNGVLVIF